MQNREQVLKHAEWIKGGTGRNKRCCVVESLLRPYCDPTACRAELTELRSDAHDQRKRIPPPHMCLHHTHTHTYSRHTRPTASTSQLSLSLSLSLVLSQTNKHTHTKQNTPTPHHTTFIKPGLTPTNQVYQLLINFTNLVYWGHVNDITYDNPYHETRTIVTLENFDTRIWYWCWYGWNWGWPALSGSGWKFEECFCLKPSKSAKFFALRAKTCNTEAIQVQKRCILGDVAPDLWPLPLFDSLRLHHCHIASSYLQFSHLTLTHPLLPLSHMTMLSKLGFEFIFGRFLSQKPGFSAGLDDKPGLVILNL
jgi:hypothetical protein